MEKVRKKKQISGEEYKKRQRERERERESLECNNKGIDLSWEDGKKDGKREREVEREKARICHEKDQLEHMQKKIAIISIEAGAKVIST